MPLKAEDHLPRNADKERILSLIIAHLSSTMVLCRANVWGEAAFKGHSGGHVHVHFAPWIKAEKGMLVMCVTTGMSNGLRAHDWAISWVHEVFSESHMMLREIGSDRLCDMDNERFYPLVGLDPYEVLEGERYRFLTKVQQACRRHGDMGRPFRLVGYDAEGRAIIQIWRRFVGGSVELPIEWSPRMSGAAILRGLYAQGYPLDLDFPKQERGTEKTDG